MSPIKFAQIEPTVRCNFKCVFCMDRLMAQKDISI